MPDFGIFRGFNDKLFGNKLYAGQLPMQLGNITLSQYLLDLYPNAVAAYSLRKLRTAYTGSAIRVRRSSDNTEQDIGFTISGDLDTFSLTSFCGSGNAFVTTWYDQSGKTNNATQTTAANQPQIVSSGSVILYGSRPTITFDGFNDFMATTQFLYDTSISLSYVTQRIGNSTAGSPYNPDIGIQSTTASDLGAFHYINPSFKGASYPFNTAFTSYDGFGSYANGDKYLINFDLISSSGYTVYKNNTLEKSVSTTGTIPFSTAKGFHISYQQFPLRYSYNNFSEIIMWLSDQSSNRSAINSDMNSYYSIY